MVILVFLGAVALLFGQLIVYAVIIAGVQRASLLVKNLYRYSVVLLDHFQVLE